MSRFFITTAIDYVNSRPHLGTAMRESVRGRHRTLQAAVRVRPRFLMGNDEHSQNVFKKAAEEGLDPPSHNATGWSRSSG